MQPSDFLNSAAGRVVKHERGYWAFIPHPLPPEIPLTWGFTSELLAAEKALGELAGIGRALPNPYLLIRPFMRREAVLSSRIEGTQASLSDLYYFEAADNPPAPGSDVREVRNYVLALEYGLRRLDELPISLRLLREIHAQLLEGIAAAHITPGEFRRSQNWIGPPGCTLHDAVFIPPPPPEMHAALGDLEKYWHAPSNLPLVVRLALIHYQFEAIHPFLDGNGRIGRLLISLLLCAEKLLPQPLLYLSAYFEARREEYYARLLAVSQQGAWTEWILFFLRGVAEQSRDAIRRSEALLALWREFREKFQTARSSALLLQLIDTLFQHPYLSISQAAEALQVTFRSASLNVGKLVQAGVLEELPGRSYGRIFRAPKILQVLEAV